MKLGGRRLVARRHSGVDAGVCGDEYRQIWPGVAGSCIALACDRRRGGGRGVSPPWRRSAGASVMAIVWQSPAAIFLKNYLNLGSLPNAGRMSDEVSALVCPFPMMASPGLATMNESSHSQGTPAYLGSLIPPLFPPLSLSEMARALRA